MFETTAREELQALDEVGNKRDTPCHVCGSRSYTWGSVAAQGINFTPEDASVLSKFFRFGTELPARCCDDCGNIQLFARKRKTEE
jgi:hypothetical protein